MDRIIKCPEVFHNISYDTLHNIFIIDLELIYKLKFYLVNGYY